MALLLIIEVKINFSLGFDKMIIKQTSNPAIQTNKLYKFHSASVYLWQLFKKNSTVNYMLALYNDFYDVSFSI